MQWWFIWEYQCNNMLTCGVLWSIGPGLQQLVGMHAHPQQRVLLFAWARSMHTTAVK